MNVALLKLKLGTFDLGMTHYTNLINVSKDQEECISKGYKFNEIRVLEKQEAAKELLFQLCMQIRMPRPRTPLSPGEQAVASPPARW